MLLKLVDLPIKPSTPWKTLAKQMSHESREWKMLKGGSNASEKHMSEGLIFLIPPETNKEKLRAVQLSVSSSKRSTQPDFQEEKLFGRLLP